MNRLSSQRLKLAYSCLEDRRVLTSFLPADVSLTTIRSGGNGSNAQPPISDYFLEITADPASEETRVDVFFDRATGDVTVRQQTGISASGSATFSSEVFDLDPRSSINRQLTYNGNEFVDNVFANIPGFQRLEIETHGGDDFIRGGCGADPNIGGSIHQNASVMIVNSGEGNDVVRPFINQDPNVTGPCRSEVTTEGGNDVVFGTLFNDDIDTGLGRDTIRVLGGRNVVDAGAGNDLIFGGPDRDVIDAGLGTDVVRGGAGNDLIESDNGADEIFGDAGDDTILARGGVGVTVYGGDGDDRIFTGNGADSIFRGQRR